MKDMKSYLLNKGDSTTHQVIRHAVRSQSNGQLKYSKQDLLQALGVQVIFQQT